MDVRVTGHYYDLLDRATSWANRRPRSYLWERSSRFYIAELYDDSYRAFSEAVKHAAGKKPVSGPQLANLLPIPPSRFNEEITDLITCSPVFDPHRTKWISRKDVTSHATRSPLPPQ